VDVLALGQVVPVTLGSLADLMTYESEDLDDAYTPIVLTGEFLDYGRYPHSAPWGADGREVRRSGRDSGSISIFYPLEPLELVGGSSVVAIVPLGYQPIIDVQVPNSNSYKAGGVYHHNCGKTVVGSFSKVCHTTGRYPEWWTGKVFDEPVMAWAAGDTAKNVRDIIQKELLGPPNAHGTGMIPGEDIIRCTPKAGTPDAVDTIYIKHYDANGEQDGVSTCQLKSYDQGRIAFQGTEQHTIWLDEECPMDVYMECLIRTMTTSGIVYLTFTPLKGITDVVQLFQNYDG
jgi:phage terminase large subunit-like protein